MSSLNTSMQTVDDDDDVMNYGSTSASPIRAAADSDDDDDQQVPIASSSDEQATTYALPCFLTCVSVFMGYSALVSLQERVRTRIGITGKSPEAETFDIAVSSLFYVILVMRLMHSVLFASLGATPRQRCFIGIGLLTVSLLFVVLLVFLLDCHSIALIFFIYVLGGMGISSFECNFISAITPLGPKAKLAALAAMPAGYSGLSIGSFLFFAARPNDETFVWIAFLLVACCCIASACVFAHYVKDVPFAATETSLSECVDGLRAWRSWAVPLLPNIVAMFVNQFVMILLSGAPEYVYNVPHVPLWKSGHVTVPKDVFLSVFFVCGLLGDLSSRFVAYRVKSLTPCGRVSPLEFLLISVAGGIGAMSTVGILAWPGAFVALFANGFIYASSVRRLDSLADSRYNLVALSCWLLVGDAGSSIGSTLTHTLSRAVGTAG